jgi:HK97 family phage major capsid protein
LSWELVQDVPTFQAFAITDMVLAQQMFEENLYVNGTGTGQAQGLIGNVGAGVTEEPDANGNLVSITGILDLIASLDPSSYCPHTHEEVANSMG